MPIKIRDMYMSDLAHVIDIIEQTDDDDSESAEADFEQNGVDDHFVCVEVESDTVLGVSGYRDIEGCDRSAWLSWTYLADQARGQGYGKQLLTHVVEHLKDRQHRMLFVKVSDYQDPDEGPIYADALSLYQHIGFREELVSEDFYDDGESQTILSLQLSVEHGDEHDVSVADEKPIIRFNGLYEIAETDGAYSFNWTVKKSAGLFEKRNFSSEDLKVGLDAAIEAGARKVFLTFPSNLVLIHKPLQSVGFKFVGKLHDYYEQGLHEMHFVHDLKQFY